MSLPPTLLSLMNEKEGKNKCYSINEKNAKSAKLSANILFQATYGIISFSYADGSFSNFISIHSVLFYYYLYLFFICSVFGNKIKRIPSGEIYDLFYNAYLPVIVDVFDVNNYCKLKYYKKYKILSWNMHSL